ncbi:MAG TPA: hypothetical protein VFC14_05160 [Burkholderiales bacterium]|nr:hypothetical protein [Burkholderiales bacterium]
MTRILTGRGFALALLSGLATLHVVNIAKNWADIVMLKYQAAYVVGAGIRSYLPAAAEISELMVAQLNRVAGSAAPDARAGTHNVLIGIERESGVDRIYVDAVVLSGRAWESAFTGLCAALAAEAWRRQTADEALHVSRPPGPPLPKAACRQLDPAAEYPAEPHEVLFVRATPTRITYTRIGALDWFSLAVLVGAIAAWLPWRSRRTTATDSRTS